MSKNKNNRPKEIRSLKGPSRKLELIVEDGKRYIKKHDLQHYFFDQKWKIKDFQYHFGLGHRIVRGLDLERDKALNSLGYQVIRIDLEKENLSRFMKNSDIRKCLKKYLLNQ